MPDRKTADRRLGDRRKSIPLSLGASAFSPDGSFLVIPSDLTQDFHLCNARVDNLDGYGAWLSAEQEHSFPTDDDLLLIEFDDEWVLTHHTRVAKRDGSRLLVDAPSVTERERSQLAPSTGRHDYRIKVNLPVRVRSGGDDASETGSGPRLARLVDLSRGGMALMTPTSQNYTEGEQITVRVVSWDHAVQIDAIVARVMPCPEEGKQKLALQFPDEMSVRQRESVSTFIIQVQRRDALSRSLPSDIEEIGA